ncbi:hypothetical protein ACLOJK_019423 [Asimina triloba]
MSAPITVDHQSTIIRCSTIFHGASMAAHLSQAGTSRRQRPPVGQRSADNHSPPGRKEIGSTSSSTSSAMGSNPWPSVHFNASDRTATKRQRPAPSITSHARSRSALSKTHQSAGAPQEKPSIDRACQASSSPAATVQQNSIQAASDEGSITSTGRHHLHPKSGQEPISKQGVTHPWHPPIDSSNFIRKPRCSKPPAACTSRLGPIFGRNQQGMGSINGTHPIDKIPVDGGYNIRDPPLKIQGKTIPTPEEPTHLTDRSAATQAVATHLDLKSDEIHGTHLPRPADDTQWNRVSVKHDAEGATDVRLSNTSAPADHSR